MVSNPSDFPLRLAYNASFCTYGSTKRRIRTLGDLHLIIYLHPSACVLCFGPGNIRRQSITHDIFVLICPLSRQRRDRRVNSLQTSSSSSTAMADPSGTMRAVYYHEASSRANFSNSQVLMIDSQPRNFEVREVPIPKFTDEEVLFKGLFLIELSLCPKHLLNI